MFKVFLAGVLAAAATGYSTEPVEFENFRLVGVITNQQDPLGKSIIVIKDQAADRSVTLAGGDPLPGSTFYLKSIHRHYLVYSDGTVDRKLVKTENPPRLSEVESTPRPVQAQISEEKLREETELIWERLRKRSNGQGLRVEMQEDTITAESYICDEYGCRDEVEQVDKEEY